MRWKRYLLVLFLILILGVLQVQQAFTAHEGGFFALPSYGNFLVKWLQGMKVMLEADEQQLKIPAEWLLLHGGYLFTIVGVCTQSLTGNSYYELLHSKKRVHWWTGKSIWLIKNTLLYYGLFFLVLLGLAVASGNTGVTAASEIWLGGLTYEQNVDTMVMTFVLPVLGSLCIGMMEMFLELALSPAIALIFCSGYLLAGIFTNQIWFTGNFSMFYRNAMYIGAEGISTEVGIMVSIIGMVVFFFLGRERIKGWEG